MLGIFEDFQGMIVILMGKRFHFDWFDLTPSQCLFQAILLDGDERGESVCENALFGRLKQNIHIVDHPTYLVLYVIQQT